MSRKLIILSSLVLFMLIFLQGFFHLLYNQDFYYSEYQKNNVSLPERFNMTGELFAYFRGSGNLSPDYFNQKEMLHLADVKGLIRSATEIYYFFIILFFILLYFQLGMTGDRIETLRRVFTYTGIAVLVFCALSFAVGSHFEFFFIKFHQLLFTNNLWLLNPATDKLIVLVPEQFFIDYVTSMYVQALVMALVLLVFSFALGKAKRYL